MTMMAMPADDGVPTQPAARAPARRACIIVNTQSGKKDGADAARRFAELAPDLEIREVASGSALGPTLDKAAAEGFDTLVAAGGDGTISAVAAKAVEAGLDLGVVPLGTFNYFARSLDLPQETEEALRVVEGGRPAPVQVGEVNGRVFLNNASLGIYPAILRRREKLYRRWGRSRLAAYWSVLLALLRFRSPLRLKVTVDGAVRRRKTPLVFVVNNAYQLELFGLEGAECVRSGRFALIVAPDCGRFGLVLYALRLALGLMTPKRDFELFCGSEIVVEDRLPRRLVARDGERDLMDGPFRFRVLPDALRVILPAARD